MPKVTLNRINLILSAGIVSISLYMILAPFWPYVTLWLSQQKDESQGFVYQGKLAKDNSIPPSALMAPPLDNRLVIPKIEVDAPIVEGDNVNAMLSGIWRRPQSSQPDKGGNTVLTGHRFQYTSGPNTFYHLDKLAAGDSIIVFWQGQEYDYKIVEVQIVDPNAVEIEANTPESLLTLYTCTPLWTAHQRLVIKAQPIEPSGKTT